MYALLCNVTSDFIRTRVALHRRRQVTRTILSVPADDGRSLGRGGEQESGNPRMDSGRGGSRSAPIATGPERTLGYSGCIRELDRSPVGIGTCRTPAATGRAMHHAISRSARYGAPECRIWSPGVENVVCVVGFVSCGRVQRPGRSPNDPTALFGGGPLQAYDIPDRVIVDRSYSPPRRTDLPDDRVCTGAPTTGRCREVVEEDQEWHH